MAWYISNGMQAVYIYELIRNNSTESWRELKFKSHMLDRVKVPVKRAIRKVVQDSKKKNRALRVTPLWWHVPWLHKVVRYIVAYKSSFMNS